jgi:hypothetical protein
VVYAHILIDSISEVYTYVRVLFDVVSYICVLVYCVSPCSNIIRLDVFKVIRFEIKVKNVYCR